MSIAVVIVNFNSGRLLAKCLAALAQQTLEPARVIIVDNDSDDPYTLARLGRITEAEIIHAGANLGYGAAINLAVRQLIDEDFVCCLNPDAFPEPDWLQRLEKAARDNPGYASFASLMLKAGDEAIVDGAGDLLHISGIAWRRFHGCRRDDLSLTTRPVFSACGGAAMYRLDDFRRAGGFDESYFMYIEDVDLGFRLQLARRPCLFVHDAVVHHIGSAITGKRSAFTLYHGHRNLSWCFFKNMPAVLLLACLPLHLAMSLLAILRYMPAGHARTMLKARRDALKGIPERLRARRSHPATTSEIWRLLDKSLMR